MSTFGSGYGVVDGGGKGEKSRVEIALFGGGGRSKGYSQHFWEQIIPL